MQRSRRCAWFSCPSAASLISGERSVFLEPFTNDRALAARALAALRGTADAAEPKLAQSAAALRPEAQSLEGRAEDLQKEQHAVPGSILTGQP